MTLREDIYERLAKVDAERIKRLRRQFLETP
jgi:hypothetical protein